jgi:hypothetical protein
MSRSLKNILLGTVVLILLGLAGFQYLRHRAAGAYPDDPTETSTWLCAQCGRQIALTPRRLQEWIESPDKIWRDPNAPAKQLVFWCDTCKAYTVCGAEQCPRHQTWYLPFGPTGDARQCPQCQPATTQP